MSSVAIEPTMEINERGYALKHEEYEVAGGWCHRITFTNAAIDDVYGVASSQAAARDLAETKMARAIAEYEGRPQLPTAASAADAAIADYHAGASGRWGAAGWIESNLDLLHEPGSTAAEKLTDLSTTQLKAVWQVLDRNYDHRDWQDFVFDALARRLEQAVGGPLR